MSSDMCPFYLYEDTGWFSSSTKCKVTNQEITSKTREYYCDGHYDRCPNYKPSCSSDGCYLTSACVDAMGLCDNCDELTILRRFRDSWLSNQDGGKEEIDEYYRTAPAIVERIRSSGDGMQTFKNLFFSLVVPCVELIRSGKNEEAHELYRAATVNLKNRYL